MGRIERRSICGITITNNLSTLSLVNIYEFYDSGREGELVPPAIRPEGLVLDGNNRVVIADVFGRTELDFYVAEDENDLMTEQMFPHAPADVLRWMNGNIDSRYDLVRSGLIRRNNIQRMRSGYPFLKDVETAREYLREFKARYNKPTFPIPE